MKASACLCPKGRFYFLTLSLVFPYGNRAGSRPEKNGGKGGKEGEGKRAGFAP